MLAATQQQHRTVGGSSRMMMRQQLSAIAPTRPLAAPHHNNRNPLLLQRQQLCRASNTSSSSTSSSSFSEQAQRLADSAQQKMQDFVKQQKLDEKAAEASKEAQKRMKIWGEEAEQNMRRTYMKLESEHNLNQRFKRTKTWAEETVRDIDQEWSVRRRLKTAAEDVQRKLPVWRRQLAAFSTTPLGKGVLMLTFVGLLFSGLLWQLVNAFWLLFWLSIPVSALIASQRSRSDEAAQQQQQQQQQQRSSSPFGGWGGGSSGSSYGSGGRGGSNTSEGPIVEAEWVSLDEGDDVGGSSRKRR